MIRPKISDLPHLPQQLPHQSGKQLVQQQGGNEAADGQNDLPWDIRQDISAQRPDLVRRLNPEIGASRLVNLLTAWRREIMEIMGGMGINSIEALRGNRLMLRGVGLNEKELETLGISHAGE